MLNAEIRPRARIGLVIPSVNTMTEPQFNRYAPDGVDVHVARVRIAYLDGRLIPSHDLLPDVVQAAELLADARCDLIVFHCTASSMEAGVKAEREIVEAIEKATGRQSTTTASAVLAAFRSLGITKVVLVSPYPASTNQHEVRFLAEAGIQVLHDCALDLPSSQWTARPGEFWVETGLAEADPEADALFLSCTNVRGAEAVEALEARTGRPVVTSNQAVLWYALRACGLPDVIPGLGGLFKCGLPVAAAAV